MPLGGRLFPQQPLLELINLYGKTLPLVMVRRRRDALRLQPRRSRCPQEYLPFIDPALRRFVSGCLSRDQPRALAGFGAPGNYAGSAALPPLRVVNGSASDERLARADELCVHRAA